MSLRSACRHGLSLASRHHSSLVLHHPSSNAVQLRSRLHLMHTQAQHGDDQASQSTDAPTTTATATETTANSTTVAADSASALQVARPRRTRRLLTSIDDPTKTLSYFIQRPPRQKGTKPHAIRSEDQLRLAAMPDDASQLEITPLPMPAMPHSDAAVVPHSQLLAGRTFHIETYGCAMNESDSQVVAALLTRAGAVHEPELGRASIVLVNTCAIREGAERKIWTRLRQLDCQRVQQQEFTSRDVNAQRQAAKESQQQQQQQQPQQQSDVNPQQQQQPRQLIAVLGCTAERLKAQLLEVDRSVDIICGPDAYRRLPHLIAAVAQHGATNDAAAMDVQLSIDETYADISPLRLATAEGAKSPHLAYLSITRGCDNFCSYCVVPRTRGVERSRDPESILAEVRQLASEGVKEIVLLGQNCTSWRYNTPEAGKKPQLAPTRAAQSRGFVNISRRVMTGMSFTQLLDRASAAAPEVRFRFTSPHPKDMPDELIELMSQRSNICRCIHLPAQSGSTSMLRRMRRGYSRSSYLHLVDSFRAHMPDITFTTDMIAGFCGETPDEHEHSVALLRSVKYGAAFLYAYSQRAQTHAHRTMTDDVPAQVKQQRVAQLIQVYHETLLHSSHAMLGSLQLVLVDGRSRRSSDDEPQMSGRADSSRRVHFPDVEMCADYEASLKHKASDAPLPVARAQSGQYCVVRITACTSFSLNGEPLGMIDSLQRFYELHPRARPDNEALQRIAQRRAEEGIDYELEHETKEEREHQIALRSQQATTTAADDSRIVAASRVATAG